MLKSISSHALLTMMSALAVIGTAHAEGAPASAGGGFASLVPLLLIMVIFYFLLIRPQQKRVKEHRNMIESLKKGDKVITGGGIYGTITDVKDDFLRIEIADGVRIKVRQDSISSLAD